jgi:predicted secreted protein
MPVPLPLAIALYFTIWWVVLFAVLPFGITSQHETGKMTPGTDPGAPMAPRLWLKALATTLISAVVFAAALWALYYFG